MLTKLMTATAAVLILTAAPSEARRHQAGFTDFCGDRYCGSYYPQAERPRLRWAKSKKYRQAKRLHARKKITPRRGLVREVANTRSVVVSIERTTSVATKLMPHPEGCPRRLFCGCGTSLYIFGRNIRELWLSGNWFRFPPSEPGPMKVAVRRGHVFAIIKNLGGGNVLAYDPNSGGRKTRIHVRNLRGYSVRDPMAGSASSWAYAG